MRVYRVCNQWEAVNQQVGQPWRAPRERPGTYRAYSDIPGLYATAYPEWWRRRLNSGANEGPVKPFLYGIYWDHTLWLDIPTDSLETRSELRLDGAEYRLDNTSLTIVRGIADPNWPPPDWCPQPTSESEWDPYSTDWQDRSILKWQPTISVYFLDREEEE